MQEHPGHRGQADSRPPRTSLAALLSTVHIRVEPEAQGWVVQTASLRAADILGITMPRVTPDHTVIISGRRDRPIRPDSSDEDLRWIPWNATADAVPLEGVPTWFVRVEGPVETGDAVAIDRAIRHGRSPLEAELRADTAVVTGVHRLVTAWIRRRDAMLGVGAEMLRRYIAGWCRVDDDEIAPPEVELVDHLLGASGSLILRPIETQAYSTFIDVGISSDHAGSPNPADLSVIYDIVSNTWHDAT